MRENKEYNKSETTLLLWTNYLSNTILIVALKKLKKNGACVFWAPVFFLSLLAGKF